MVTDDKPTGAPVVGYRYRAHGVTIASDLELPALMPTEAEPDVVIRYGDTPLDLAGQPTRRRRYAAAAGEYLLDLPRIARYWVREGREVVVAPLPGASLEDVRLFLLSSVMAALVHQRGALPMHASAVEVDGHCVLFAGRPGAGKSTLAAAFHAGAHRVIAEDLAVVSLDAAGRPQVHPGARQFRLQADSLAWVAAGRGSAAVRGKHHVEFEPASPAPVPIDRIFVFEGPPGEVPALRRITGAARVPAVAAGTYRRPISLALGQSRTHFGLCVAVGTRVPVVALRRTTRLADLPQLVQLVRAELAVAPAAGA